MDFPFGLPQLILFSPRLLCCCSQVSDPVQHADGLQKYTSYRVDVLNESSVLRRYSDFLWLYERLHADRPGAIVPALPEKQPINRFNATFVEERRLHLERWIRRVFVHPELHDCGCIDVFLRADDMSFQAAKQVKKEAVQPLQASMMGGSYMSQQPSASMLQSSTSNKQGLKRWFAETKTSMTGDLVRSPDDDIFEEIQRYIHGLDTQMKSVTQQASGLVRKSKEIANGLFEFGLAFNLLGQSEADSLGTALVTMGETADRLSVLAGKQAELEFLKFEEPLQDYLKQIHAVKLALQRRHEKRVTYSTCLADVATKQSSLSKLRSQIGAEAKAYTVEMSLRKASEQADLARDDFSACSQRVLREVDRFKRDKTEEMRSTVLAYIKLQVQYSKQMEQIWGALIPELEKVPLDTTGAMDGSSMMAPQPPPPMMAQGPISSPESTTQAPPPEFAADSMISVQYREQPTGY